MRAAGCCQCHRCCRDRRVFDDVLYAIASFGSLIRLSGTATSSRMPRKPPAHGRLDVSALVHQQLNDQADLRVVAVTGVKGRRPSIAKKVPLGSCDCPIVGRCADAALATSRGARRTGREIFCHHGRPYSHDLRRLITRISCAASSSRTRCGAAACAPTSTRCNRC
jgi:hypothetical protein